MTAKEVIGIGWSFPPRFSRPGSAPDTSEGSELLDQSILVLLNTRIGERSLDPKYGSGLSDFVFGEATPLMLTELKEEIARAVLEYEPRIRLNSIDYDLSDLYDGRINIVLEYTIKQTNARNNMVYPFYLTEKSI